MKVKPRFYILSAWLGGILTLWIIFQDDLFLQLLVLLVLLMLISYISARLSLRGIIIQRSSRYHKMTIGNYFEDHFDIENKHAFWKQWIEICDYSGISGNPQEIRVLTGLDAKKVRTFNTYTFLRKRGVYNLGPLKLTSGDFLGCFEFNRWVESQKRLVVLPRIIELDRFAHLPAYLSGGKELKVASLETTPFAAGVREYYPGDSLRRIHWPTTARKQRLMVKEFDRDPQMNTWIILDCEMGNHYEKQEKVNSNHPSDYWSVRQQTKYALPCSTFEYAVTVAASITQFFIAHNYGVGLITSGQQAQMIVSDHGYRQLGRILDILAYVQPDGNTPFTGFTGEYLKHINRGSTVILISTILDKSLLELIDMALARGLRPIYICVRKSSFSDSSSKVEDDMLIRGEMAVRSVPFFSLD
ncbi:MAG TPA: hypothetical protein DCK95_03230, partial [Anaerolineaceae bacterium]